MASLFDRNLIYVTGKGGVGRSTVAAALGLAAAERGRRTIVCEVAEQDRLSRLFRREAVGDEETELTENLWAVSIGPQRALNEWLSQQLGSRALAKLLFDNNAFQYFAAAAPGANEIATIVKVWEIAQPNRWDKQAATYDLVIVDAPASGHGLAMLRTPRTFSSIARVGPIRKQADRVSELLADKRRTAYLAVALAEEMPVNETLELQRGLQRDVGAGLAAIVVNGLYPKRFSQPEIERTAALAARAENGHRAALSAARTEHRWAKGQQSQLGRLRRRADAPVVTLPFLFEPELGLDEYSRLAGELARKL